MAAQLSDEDVERIAQAVAKAIQQKVTEIHIHNPVPALPPGTWNYPQWWQNPVIC